MPNAASMMYVFVVFNNYLFVLKINKSCSIHKQLNIKHIEIIKHAQYINIYNKPCSNEAFVSKIRFRIMVIM